MSAPSLQHCIWLLGVLLNYRKNPELHFHRLPLTCYRSVWLKCQPWHLPWTANFHVQSFRVQTNPIKPWTLVLYSGSLLQHPRRSEIYPPVLKFLYNTGTLLPLALDNTECKNTSLNSPVHFLGHHHLPPDYRYWCYLGLCCCSGHCLNESLLAQSHSQWVLHYLATKLTSSVDKKESSKLLEESPDKVVGVFISTITPVVWTAELVPCKTPQSSDVRPPA